MLIAFAGGLCKAMVATGPFCLRRPYYSAFFLLLKFAWSMSQRLQRTLLGNGARSLDGVLTRTHLRIDPIGFGKRGLTTKIHGGLDRPLFRANRNRRVKSAPDP